jgi:hypothetical protein
MRNAITKSLLMFLFLTTTCAAQALPAKWEELTAPDFVKALEQAKGTCIIPFGILEKHGPAGSLGTDLINVRHGTLMAVKEEYAIVFPEYYFGRIFRAAAWHNSLQFPHAARAAHRDDVRNGSQRLPEDTDHQWPRWKHKLVAVLRAISARVA